MKRIIRSVFVPVFIAIILGYIGGRFVYTTYKDNLYDTLRSSRLYLVENGEYDNILDMREENSGKNRAEISLVEYMTFKMELLST